MEVHEITADRILNPTSIDLGEYVINPYLGCEYSCLYCYVQSNKNVVKRKRPWGSYVDIRGNALALLEKEIAIKRPKTVLLGSTTECFQPIERERQLTGKILTMLNTYRVSYVILTRSPFIVDAIHLLDRGFCKRVYFTLNNFPEKFKQLVEPKSPAFVSRINAVRKLLDEGIDVIPYYSPVIPWVTNIDEAFSSFEKAKRIEFEYLNFQTKNIREIITNISLLDTTLQEKLTAMFQKKDYHEKIWNELDKKIGIQAQIAKKEYKVYKHKFGDFFQNTYLSNNSKKET
ncbi:MAG: hypothetical protein MRJ65_14620 [Candidatus Brocadiaceae bacterium]|nr:hypothetical protein [Candidatus Brocadiaceae bacterium]